MGAWEHLIESRIRDWQRRQRAGEVTKAPDPVPVESLETQLFAEMVSLRRRALAEPDPARRHAALEEAECLRIRLSVLLEKHGFHSLARSLDARIEAALREDDQG